MRCHVSATPPKALSSLIAIPGKFRHGGSQGRSCLRLTFRVFAACVTDRPKGSRQSPAHSRFRYINLQQNARFQLLLRRAFSLADQVQKPSTFFFARDVIDVLTKSAPVLDFHDGW